MLKINGNDILRNGQKVGWVEDDDVYSYNGKKLGYFSDNDVYSADGRKIAYTNGNYLYASGGADSRVSLNKVNTSVVGGVLPLIGKCAVYVLIGA
ncbi:MAG: hypothetical protein Q8Q37_01005 [bacterium]|nr:hypothetical protein [bacterium]